MTLRWAGKIRVGRNGSNKMGYFCHHHTENLPKFSGSDFYKFFELTSWFLHFTRGEKAKGTLIWQFGIYWSSKKKKNSKKGEEIGCLVV